MTSPMQLDKDGVEAARYTTRLVPKAECPWLDADIPPGRMVFVYSGPTYGVIGPDGVAVTDAPDTVPFYELPRAALSRTKAEAGEPVADDPAYLEGPFYYVPMPINSFGMGPEMDPDKVQWTQHEVWNALNLSIATGTNATVARAIATALSLNAAPPTRSAIRAEAFALLEQLRGDGWSVAVHNDYRQAGALCTFWLFTHPSGRWAKGEGKTDIAALEQCVAAIRALAPTAGGEGESRWLT